MKFQPETVLHQSLRSYHHCKLLICFEYFILHLYKNELGISHTASILLKYCLLNSTAKTLRERADHFTDSEQKDDCGSGNWCLWLGEVGDDPRVLLAGAGTWFVVCTVQSMLGGPSPHPDMKSFFIPLVILVAFLPFISSVLFLCTHITHWMIFFLQEQI